MAAPYHSASHSESSFIAGSTERFFPPAVDQRKETNMDFIERLFGFAPDGGNGMFELLLFAIPIAGILILAARRRKRSAKR